VVGQGIGEGLTSQGAVLRGKATMQVCEGRSHIPSTSLSLRRASGGTVLVLAILTPQSTQHASFVNITDKPAFKKRQEKCEIMKYSYSIIYQGTVGAVGILEEGHMVLRVYWRRVETQS